MRFALLFWDERMVRALGWSLLHFLWQGAVVAALLAVALRVLRGHSARVRYALGCGALALMMLLPLVTFAYLVLSPGEGAGGRVNVAGRSMMMVASGGGWDGAAGTWAGGLVLALDRALPWMLAAWGMGVLVFLGRLNVGMMAARRITRMASGTVSAELQRAFVQMKARLGIAKPVVLMHSMRVQVPTVIGWLRPAVLIPVECLTGLSGVQIEAILAHELAHIRRHDYLVSLMQSVVEAVLFYQPAVWWVSRQVRIEREVCCDDVAVGVSGDSLAYAKALSLLEERRSNYPALTVGADGGSLVMRIKRLLGYEEVPAFSQAAGLTLLVVMAIGVVLGAGTLARAQASADRKMAEQRAAEEAKVPLLYRKWLDEDVRWIITTEEIKQFSALSSDEERNEFIRQFWQRRGELAGGGDGNAYRKEYYRRVAYANQHFAQGTAGWKTDKGRDLHSLWTA